MVAPFAAKPKEGCADMANEKKKKNNPQNKYILDKYKDYLTEDEKYFLENDALVRPRYRTSKPVGKDSRGEAYYGYSYAPEFKESSMDRSTRSYDAGAGRGRVNPKNAKKNGGAIKYRGGGCVTKKQKPTRYV